MQVHFNCYDYFHIASEKERIRDREIASHQIQSYSNHTLQKTILDGIYKDGIIKMGYPRKVQPSPFGMISLKLLL